MDRPEIMTKQELQNPPAEQSASMQRGQAFAHDGIWAGLVVFPGGATTAGTTTGTTPPTATSLAEE
jgi:hypothetical protein